MLHRKVFDIIPITSLHNGLYNKEHITINKKLRSITSISKELKKFNEGYALISVNMNYKSSYGFCFDGIIIDDTQIYITQIEKYFILPINCNNNLQIPNEYIDLYIGQSLDDEIEKLPTICIYEQIESILLKITKEYNKNKYSNEVMTDILFCIRNLIERLPYYEEKILFIDSWLIDNYNIHYLDL